MTEGLDIIFQASELINKIIPQQKIQKRNFADTRDCLSIFEDLGMETLGSAIGWIELDSSNWILGIITILFQF